MKTTYGQLVLAGLATVLSLFVAGPALARPGAEGRLPYEIPVGLPGASSWERDLPVRAPKGGARADTVTFGYYTIIGGNKYAVMGETWTFDRGGTDPLEGWYSKDLTVNDGAYFRRIDASTWAGHGNTVAAPIPDGAGAAWIGLFEDEADARCWDGGLGYGNHWLQRWQSPLLTYDGSGDVQLSFDYFNDTEEDFDYTRVLVRLGSGEELSLNGVGFTGVLGDPATSTYANAAMVIQELEFAGETEFRLVFELDSDGAWSDQDGDYETEYSAFGVDNVSVVGNLGGGDLAYDYEADAQGWTGLIGNAIGAQIGVADISEYLIADDCACELAGNVLEYHDDALTPGHPVGQHEMSFSPPADKSALGASYNSVFAALDIYGEMPQANGVFYRPGWNYYPFICPNSGVEQWSGRVGQALFNYTGELPICTSVWNNAGSTVPVDAELVSFVWEIYASCDAFSISPTYCSGVTNFSPILDNIEIRMTNVPAAPPISFDPGTHFADGFPIASTLSPTSPGNANIVWSPWLTDFGAPRNLGDSLTVVGPASGPGWEARMWWRIRREGPGQASVPNYTTWKTIVADGLSIVGPGGQFTFGHMDSTQVGFQALKNKRISEFRENDDDFAGERTDNNEMIRDGILAPGTQIQYFLSGNYASTPTIFFTLPDTSGGNYLEFEILPSYRLDGGVLKFPCILTIDANTGNQFFVEHALNAVLNGAGVGDPIPNPTRWDRYDYADAGAKWSAPIARTPGGNNGMTLFHLLGYRQVIFYSGDRTSGAYDTDDFTLISDWLNAPYCNGNGARQGFIGNGSDLARILSETAPTFLHNVLGASFSCDAYHTPGCGPTPGDDNNCVRLEAAPGAQYPPGLDYNAWGNWCPAVTEFDVLGTASSGVGNRVYRQIDGVATNYAQVVKSVVGGGSSNYRSVLDGVPYNRLSERDLTDECVGDSAHIVAAVASELGAALAWIFGGAGAIPNLCSDVCSIPVDVEAGESGAATTRLFQNHPNPFNPRTTIQYSLAAAGPVQLVIYDVSGRKVRTLVDGATTQGAHSVVWDGVDDAGHKVGSGVYWSQLVAGEYRSNKKMVILK